MFNLRLASADIAAFNEAERTLGKDKPLYKESLSFKYEVGTLLKSNLQDPPSEKYAAKLLGYSERNFRRKLKRENTCYRTLLQQTRLDYAKKQLRNESDTIECIAFELGYQNASSFCRTFKSWTGVSPSCWNKSNSILDKKARDSTP